MLPLCMHAGLDVFSGSGAFSYPSLPVYNSPLPEPQAAAAPQPAAAVQAQHQDAAQQAAQPAGSSQVQQRAAPQQHAAQVVAQSAQHANPAQPAAAGRSSQPHLAAQQQTALELQPGAPAADSAAAVPSWTRGGLGYDASRSRGAPGSTAVPRPQPSRPAAPQQQPGLQAVQQQPVRQCEEQHQPQQQSAQHPEQQPAWQQQLSQDVAQDPGVQQSAPGLPPDIAAALVKMDCQEPVRKRSRSSSQPVRQAGQDSALGKASDDLRAAQPQQQRLQQQGQQAAASDGTDVPVAGRTQRRRRSSSQGDMPLSTAPLVAPEAIPSGQLSLRSRSAMDAEVAPQLSSFPEPSPAAAGQQPRQLPVPQQNGFLHAASVVTSHVSSPAALQQQDLGEGQSGMPAAAQQAIARRSQDAEPSDSQR